MHIWPFFMIGVMRDLIHFLHSSNKVCCSFNWEDFLGISCIYFMVVVELVSICLAPFEHKKHFLLGLDDLLSFWS